MESDKGCEEFDDGSIQMLLLKTSHLFFARSYEQLSEKGLHPGQVPMLRILKRKGELSQREIAGELHVKPPSVAVSIRRMEASGLLVRTPDKRDQRVTRISLTPKGIEMAEAIEEIFEKNQKILTAGFTESEACLLRRFLLQIIDNMKSMK